MAGAGSAVPACPPAGHSVQVSKHGTIAQPAAGGAAGRPARLCRQPPRCRGPGAPGCLWAAGPARQPGRLRAALAAGAGCCSGLPAGAHLSFMRLPASHGSLTCWEHNPEHAHQHHGRSRWMCSSSDLPTAGCTLQVPGYRAQLSPEAKAALTRVLYAARHILASTCRPLRDAGTQADLLPLMLQARRGFPLRLLP